MAIANKDNEPTKKKTNQEPLDGVNLSIAIILGKQTGLFLFVL